MHHWFLRLLVFSLWLSLPNVLASDDSSFSSSNSTLTPSLINVPPDANLPMLIDFPDAPDSAQNVVQDNFLGISIELSVLNYLWGESPKTMPGAMQNYLSNIRERMDTSSPLRIRIGGNSMDGHTYDPNQKSMLVADLSEHFNYATKALSVGPMLFDVMNAMSNEVGSMDFLLGLTLRLLNASSNMVDFASAAQTALGPSLGSLLLGNEPDLYIEHTMRGDDYSIQDYVSEVKNMFSELETSSYGNLLKDKLIGGPTVCCRWFLDDILDAGMDDLPYKYNTLQHYPTSDCKGSSKKSSNLTYYITHSNTVEFIQYNLPGLNEALEKDVPLVMTEYNTASCGGDATVGPSFASALWAIDTALQGATKYFHSMYMHTREIGVYYNLFAPSSANNSLQGNWTTGAVYYAQLVLAEAFSPNGSVVHDLNLGGGKTDDKVDVAGYAIWDLDEQGSKEKSKLALFNFAYPRSNALDVAMDVNTTRTFSLPSNLTSEIGIRYLLAPNVSSTATPAPANVTSNPVGWESGVSWAGQVVDGMGSMVGAQTMEVVPCSEGCEIVVPGPGMALVWMDVEGQLDAGRIFVGNSTSVSVGLVNDVGEVMQG